MSQQSMVYIYNPVKYEGDPRRKFQVPSIVQAAREHLEALRRRKIARLLKRSLRRKAGIFAE